MSEVNWTPGPWRLGERDGDFIDIDAPKHTGLATVVWQMEDDRLCGEESPQQQANARLMAAAPDLYAALVIARRYVADAPVVGDADLAIVDAALDLARKGSPSTGEG